jgi:hypothetical protein
MGNFTHRHVPGLERRQLRPRLLQPQQRDGAILFRAGTDARIVRRRLGEKLQHLPHRDIALARRIVQFHVALVVANPVCEA